MRRPAQLFGLGAMPKPGAAGRRHVCPRHGGAALGHGTRKTSRNGLRVGLCTVGAVFSVWAAATTAGPITALTFSPDGSALLSARYDEVTVRLLNGSATVRVLTCRLARVHDLAFSPDGRTLAVAGGETGVSGGVCLLDWPTGRIRSTWEPHDDVITAVAFHPDGSRLATASADGTAEIRRLVSPSGREPAESPDVVLSDHAGAVLGVAFGPRGRLLATVSADRALKAWDSTTGRLLRSFSNHTGIIHCVAFAPLLRGEATASIGTCATGSDDKTVRVWQPATGRMVRIVRGSERAVLALVYAVDGQTLYAAGADGIIRAIDVESDRFLRTWPAHEDWIYSLAISPDGKRLASGDARGTVKLWDAARAEPVATWPKPNRR